MAKVDKLIEKIEKSLDKKEELMDKISFETENYIELRTQCSLSF